MSNIIIKKENINTYQIKIYEEININDINILKDISKEIINKIKKKYFLKKEIVLDIYPSKYETIIELSDYNRLIYITNETKVKINIHTSTTFLYEIDYPINNKYNGIVYYYKNKYYLKIKEISQKDYLYLSEYSKLIYKDTNKILDNGLKIKI